MESIRPHLPNALAVLRLMTNSTFHCLLDQLLMNSGAVRTVRSSSGMESSSSTRAPEGRLTRSFARWALRPQKTTTASFDRQSNDASRAERAKFARDTLHSASADAYLLGDALSMLNAEVKKGARYSAP
jgi:hypothetical protein